MVSEISIVLLSAVLFLSASASASASPSPYALPLPSASASPSPPPSASPLASASASHIFLPETFTTPPIVVSACKASRDPPSCMQTVSDSGLVPPSATALRVIKAALNITFRNLNTAQSMVEDVIAGSSGNQNLSTAAKVCNEVLGYAKYRITKTDHDGLLGRKIKDGRAWLSAALAYQYDSWSSLKKHNDTSDVVDTMAFLNDTVIAMTGTTLSMLANYDVHGENVGEWGPVKTERDGYWEPVGSGADLDDFDGGVPKGMKVNVTVCKDGRCDFTKIQDAVNAAPALKSDRRFVIWIKAGVYEEMVRVPLMKLNVVFLGDGMGKTVITGSLHAGQPGTTTYHSATVGVLGDGFMASNLTFENKGIDYQAVAFRSDADHTVLENCEFIGNQDTIYAKCLRQYYKSCCIHGNVDFIFGNAAAFFKDCEILITPRYVNPEKGEKNAITAHGRIDPAQTIGLVFYNCTVTGTENFLKLYRDNPKVHHSYLGRPWKEYSRTIFIKCKFEDIIAKEGWYPWQDDFALSTLYYGEFENTGPGADTSGRVKWSSDIPAEHVNSYSVQNFIQGDQWIPKAG